MLYALIAIFILFGLFSIGRIYAKNTHPFFKYVMDQTDSNEIMHFLKETKANNCRYNWGKGDHLTVRFFDGIKEVEKIEVNGSKQEERLLELMEPLADKLGMMVKESGEQYIPAQIKRKYGLHRLKHRGA